MSKEIQEEYFRIISSIKFNESNLDYLIFEKHLEQIKILERYSASSYSIFDMFKLRHSYLSGNFAKTFGFDLEEAEKEGNAYFDSRIHEDDYLRGMKAGTFYLNYSMQLSPEEKKKLKFVGEYRMRNGNNKIIRVIEQHQILELDPEGNMWLGLGVMDISPDQDMNAPYRCRMINYHTGEIHELPENFFTDNTSTPKLSGREKEILKLIATGLLSKEIADQLYISVHTVNTHRQKILEKLNADNTMEAVELARRVGIL
jgi:DNA-binding CsgD family transcriptional regulator